MGSDDPSISRYFFEVMDGAVETELVPSTGNSTPPAPANINDKYRLKATVTNLGNTEITNLSVAASNGLTMTCDSTNLGADTGTTECQSKEFALTQAEIESGVLTRSVTGVTARTSDGINFSFNPTETWTAEEPIVQNNNIFVLASSLTATGPVVVGAELSLKATIVNDGNTTVTDLGAEGFTCVATTLEPAQGTQCEKIVTVTQEDFDQGIVSQDIEITGTAGGEIVSADIAATLPTEAGNNDVTLSYVVEPDSYSGLDETIEFTVTVKNSGTISINSLTASDTEGSFVCVEESLAPGAETTCTREVTVTTAEISSGEINSTVTVRGAYGSGSSQELGSRTATATLETPSTYGSATFELIPGSGNSSPAALSDTFQYKVVVTSAWPVDLANVKVETESGVVLGCDPGTIPGNGTTECISEPINVTQADIDAGEYTGEIVSVTAENSAQVAVPFGNDGTWTITEPLVQNPVMSTSAVFDPANGTVAEGDVIDFVATITNTGNTTITDLGTLVGGTCVPTQLAPGSSTATCTVPVTLTADDAANTPITRTIVITGDSGGESLSNPTTATREVPSSAPGDVVVTEDGGSGTGTPGADIEIKNDANEAICSTTVLPDGTWSCDFPEGSAPGAGDTVNVVQNEGNKAPSDPIVKTVEQGKSSLPGDVVVTEDGGSGTGTPGADIEIKNGDDEVICSTTVLPNGSWSCVFPEGSAPGSGDIVNVVQKEENKTPSDPIAKIVAQGQSLQPGDVVVTEDQATGTGTPLATIIIKNEAGDETLCTTNVGFDGKWTCVFPEGSAPGAGDNVNVIQKEENKTPSDPIVKTVDEGKSTQPGDVVVTEDGGSGTGTPGADIEIRNDADEVICSTTVLPDGSWSCDFPEDKKPGAGDSVNVIQDEENKAPSDPIVKTVEQGKSSLPGDVVVTEDGGSGTGTPGADIEIKNDANEVICSTTVEPDGTWSCDFPEDKKPGAGDSVNVIQKEENKDPSDPIAKIVAQGQSLQPGDVVVTEDQATGTGTPLATIIIKNEAGDETLCTTNVGFDGKWTCVFPEGSAPGAGDNVNVIQEELGKTPSDPIVATVLQGKASAPGDVVVTEDGGSGTGNPGADIEIKNGDDEVICSTTVLPDGSWSCDFPEDKKPGAGDSVNVIQKEENKDPFDPIVKTVDEGKSTQPGDVVVTEDGGSGTGTPGADIEIRNDADELICSTTVETDGSWSCVFPEGSAPGAGDSVNVIQKEENKTPSDPIVKTVDQGKSSQPGDVVVTEDQGSGTGTPGADIEIKNGDDEVICSTKVESDGSWVCVFPEDKKPGPGETVNVIQDEEDKGPSDPLVIVVANTNGGVSLAGNPVAGQTLVATGTGFPAGTTFSYIWETSVSSLFDNPYVIPGATDETLVLTASQVKTWVRVRVTATIPGGSPVEIISGSTGPVQFVNLRVGGETRYSTNQKIVEKFSEKGKPMFVATGRDFADALSAGPAASKLDGSIAFTQPNVLSPEAAASIKNRQPSEVIIVGMTGAVSKNVEQQIRALGVKVTRIGGKDRYETSLKIFDAYLKDSATTVYVATGRDFADALVSGPAASVSGGGVLLVNGTEGSNGTTTKNVNKALGSSQVGSIVIAGGSAAVSTGVENTLRKQVSNVARVGGADRYATAVKINQVFPKTTEQLWIVTGTVFADAVSSSAPAGVSESPVYLSRSNCVPKVVSDAVNASDRRYATRVFIGQTKALSNQVMNMTVCR